MNNWPEAACFILFISFILYIFCFYMQVFEPTMVGRILTLHFCSIDGSGFEMNVTDTNSTGSRLLVRVTEQDKTKAVGSVSSLGDAMVVTFRSSRLYSSSVNLIVTEGRGFSFLRKNHCFMQSLPSDLVLLEIYTLPGQQHWLWNGLICSRPDQLRTSHCFACDSKYWRLSLLHSRAANDWH